MDGDVLLSVGASILFALLLIWHFKEENRRYRECTVPIKAEILDVKKERTREDGHHASYIIYVPIVKYRYWGQDYTIRVSADNRNPNLFIVGDTLILHINPKKPTEYVFKYSANWQYQQNIYNIYNTNGKFENNENNENQVNMNNTDVDYTNQSSNQLRKKDKIFLIVLGLLALLFILRYCKFFIILLRGILSIIVYYSQEAFTYLTSLIG